MRRTRWDQKPGEDEPVASGSRWNSQCNPIDWEHHNRSQVISNERDQLSTPRPLDYSSERRRRDQKNTASNVNKDGNNSSHEKESSDSLREQSTSMHASPWPYMSNMQHMYPGSSQNAQRSYLLPNPWNQMQQGFYSNNDFCGDNIFDMKWWESQRNSLNPHPVMNDNTSKDHHQKFEQSSPNHWSFGTRVQKHNDRSFEYARKYSRNFNNFRSYSHNSNLFNRYNDNNEAFKDDGPPNQQKWRFNNREYNNHPRSQEYFQPNLPPNPNIGGSVKRNLLKLNYLNKSSKGNKPKKSQKKVGKVNLKQRKKEKKKDSTAELAKKKALATAANKLKQTFLAAKKKTNKKSSKKLKESLKQSKALATSETSRKNLARKVSVQDLSMPKSIPKEGTSLEHDIDIKFSAHEWESVGRGEGGTQNVLKRPGSKSAKDDSEDGNSDSDSVQTISDDAESIKGSTDNESEILDSSSDEDDDPIISENEGEQENPPVQRRRHASEGITIEAESYNIGSKAKRVRSYSTSQVEQGSPPKESPSKSSPLSSNLKNMLVKQLLTMDQKSLKELVDDPKSRKAQFMMSHFMDMHRNVLSQKLNHLRFKSISASSSAVEDLSILQSFNPSHLQTLPSDILEQVKEILDFEANGKAQQMWEEISLSLSDLVSGFEVAEKVDNRLSPEPLEHEDDHPPHQQKQVFNCQQELRIEDFDCQIVTPPPKQPATTITIPDSDNEIHSDHLPEVNERILSRPPLHISPPLSKVIPPLSPPTPPLPPPPPAVPNFIKPQDLIQPPTPPLLHPDRPPNPLPRSPPLGHLLSPPNPLPRSSPLAHLLSPPNPLPRSPPLAHLLSPPRPIKQSPHPQTPTDQHPLSIRHPSPPFIPPTPSVDPQRLKINIKNKILENPVSRDPCEIDLQAPAPPPPPPSIKVKQESPSPMMECGLCMHPPRSPHTPQCGFAFGLPPPLALMSNPPRNLGTAPPPRGVPHLGSLAIPTIFKQERPAASFVSLEHINRPSSEERPKNPAPPDATHSEPPSPLSIPPPPSNLHQPPPPRPLIFSPEEQFVDPPRPPSPPPPQHSPHIKMERQTPQFICCCMRNECERSNSSRQSADFRRASSTPQGQLCDSATLRSTPHSVYKYEPPYLSSLRSRTPHSGMLNIFHPVSPSARCLAPPNGPIMPSLMSSQCLNVMHSDAAHSSKVNVGVQTDKSLRQFFPNISLARSITPILNKMDQTTSTEDLTIILNSSVSDENPPNHDAMPSLPPKKFDPSSSTSRGNGVETVINNYKSWKPSGSSTNQLIQLGDHERELLACLDEVERKEREMARDRRRLQDALSRIHEARSRKLMELQSGENKASSSTVNSRCHEISSRVDGQCSGGDPPTNDGLTLNPVSKRSESVDYRSNAFGASTTSNNNPVESQYMVSSSQEISSLAFKSPVSPSEYLSNDSHSIQGERCTSTSLTERKEPFFPTAKDSSDSEDEPGSTKDQFSLKASKHKFRLGQTRFTSRKRLNSGSTSDEFDDDTIKKEKQAPPATPSSEKREERRVSVAGSSHLRKEEAKEVDEVDAASESFMKEEHDHSLTSTRKGSLTGSPQSPKMRNSSGSEHGYSLRSRGPPSDLLDFNSDSQLSKDTLVSSQEDQLDMGEEKPPPPPPLGHDKNDADQADDEFEKEEELDTRSEPGAQSSSRSSTNDAFKKRKRKRKTKYMNKCKKKKEMNGVYAAGSKPSCSGSSSSSSSSNNLEELKKEAPLGDSNEPEQSKKSAAFSSVQEEFKFPPPHLAAVLDLKVVRNLIFTTSTDGTARLFDPVSGVVLSTYQGHTDSVTTIQIVGEPEFGIGSPRFQVVTGSEDCSIHVYDGKTGVLSQQRNCSEPVRCLDYRWGYLFIGTDGGCGIKWNLKDRKLGEKIRFCGKGITHILTHVEGGRKVLVVGAKTTPIMIRDAMTGLFLRTLEYVQLTMYAGFFEGNLLYTAGSEKRIYVYDYCEGTMKGQFDSEASVSGLILVNKYIVATCYDGFIRIFSLPKGDLIHTLAVESSHKMFICSALFRNKILLGNKNGEVVCCELPNLQD